MNDKIRKYVIPNLPYLLFFWLFAKLGEAYRLAPGAEIGEKILGVVSTLGSVMASPMPSFNPVDLLVGVVGAAIVRAAVYFKGKNAKKFRHGEEYGSARWGTPNDIKPYVDPVPSNNIILTQTEGLTMNSRPKQPKYARNKNVLVIGGSGSGRQRLRPPICERAAGLPS